MVGIYTHDTQMHSARESAEISVKPQAWLCYIYVTLSKALSLCSACKEQDFVSKILCDKIRHC